MEETFFEKLIHALVFMGICAAVVFIGWREPLKYRFLSAEKIAEIERSFVQPERGSPEWNAVNGPARWNPGGSSLDRAPWEKKDGVVTYRPGSVDSRHLGLPTESARKSVGIGQH